MDQHEALGLLRGGEPGVKEWNRRRSDGEEIPDLSNTDLRAAILIEVNLRGAHLNNTNFTDANLRNADLQDASLNGAVFDAASLLNAQLCGAELEDARFRDANLRLANLNGANLKRAFLWGANLPLAYMHDCDLNGAILGYTAIDTAGFSEARGLDNLSHRKPSILSTDALLAKQRLPTYVLRGCGVPENLIAYLTDGEAIEFYSCFISYSHADKPFARRLHDQLQARGIRCWLDEKQVLPGDNIYAKVEEGIRLWDKVLLCASERSLTSGWVDDEIKHAFAKEKRLFKERGEEVLAMIPLNLDGYLLGGWQHPKKNQILERLAPDFQGWDKDNSKFEEQFERIVQALRTDEAAREKPPESKL